MARLALPVLLLLLLAACHGHDHGTEHAGEAHQGSQPKTYSVRGQVVTLPADNNGEIRLAHEAIDDFEGATGEVIGMDAMTMSFPLAEGAGHEELAVGDVVEFELSVDWSSASPATVTRIEKLPAETELGFGKAGEAEGEASAAEDD